jgi:hypothetical protein
VNDVVDIVAVDPSLIWFRRDPETNRLVPMAICEDTKDEARGNVVRTIQGDRYSDVHL